MSYSEIAIKYHQALANAVRPLRGRVITPREMRDALVAAHPELASIQDWVLPSDHCQNHTNRGACGCATTTTALFERIGRGKYRVL